MKTLIFESKGNNLSGFLECCITNGSIEINYNINSKAIPDTFFKIYALSSKKPFNKPLIADTLEFKTKTALGKCRISNSKLLQNGFTEDEIDTFAVACSIDNKYIVKAVCFSGIKWDVGKAFNEMNICETKNPAERGKEILKSIKERTKTTDPSLYNLWLDELSKCVLKMKKSENSPVSDYIWYIVENMIPPLPISAYRHLLFVTEVMTEFEKEGHYLFGVGKDGHTALAIKSDRFNPFINANDCAVKIDGYFIVGILLAPDGQYFEKINM